jgi:hypothetical protein
MQKAAPQCGLVRLKLSELICVAGSYWCFSRHYMAMLPPRSFYFKSIDPGHVNFRQEILVFIPVEDHLRLIFVLLPFSACVERATSYARGRQAAKPAR